MSKDWDNFTHYHSWPWKQAVWARFHLLFWILSFSHIWHLPLLYIGSSEYTVGAIQAEVFFVCHVKHSLFRKIFTSGPSLTFWVSVKFWWGAPFLSILFHILKDPETMLHCWLWVSLNTVFCKFHMNLQITWTSWKGSPSLVSFSVH